VGDRHHPRRGLDPVDYCSTIFDPEIGDWVSGAEVADLLVDSFQ
jgi:hypothetical protein